MRLILVSVLVAASAAAALAGPAKKKAPAPTPKPGTSVHTSKDADGWVFDRRIPSKGPVRKSEVPALLKKMNHRDAR